MPQKKHIKLINADVVSVGFPKTSSLVEELTHANVTCELKNEPNRIEITLVDAIDIRKFETWKLTVKLKPDLSKALNQPVILNRIKTFPLAYKTPMEAFMFLKEIQELI
jgi:hypothetical protein